MHFLGLGFLVCWELRGLLETPNAHRSPLLRFAAKSGATCCVKCLSSIRFLYSGSRRFPWLTRKTFSLCLNRFPSKSLVRMTCSSQDGLGVISERTILTDGNFLVILSTRFAISESILSGLFVSRSLHPTLISMQSSGSTVSSIACFTECMFPVFLYVTFSDHHSFL